MTYCYNAHQPLFDKVRGVEFYSNLDVLEDLKTEGPPILLILDDFMGTGRTETIRDFLRNIHIIVIFLLCI